MIIVLDIDDVCANLIPIILLKYNKLCDDTLKLEDITDWNIGSFTKIGDKFYDYFSMPDLNLYQGMPPVKDALEGVQYLRKLKYDIVFCTAYDFHNRKWEWLKENKFTSSMDEYVVAHNKNLIKGDVIIDDNYANFSSFDGDKLLFDAPYNRKYKTAYRVNNWKDIMEKFRLLNMINGGI